MAKSGLMSMGKRLVITGITCTLLSMATGARAEETPATPAPAVSQPALTASAPTAAPAPATIQAPAEALPDELKAEIGKPPHTDDYAHATLPPSDLSPWGMFMQADWVVKAVMIGLLLASVATWTVWLAKTIEVRKAKQRARTVLAHLAASHTLEEAAARIDGTDAAAAIVQAAALEVRQSADLPGEGMKERIISRTDRIEAAAARAIGRGTGILASIGSTAPFIGLFGTVWGIMNSFIGISKSQTTNLAVVAPGIAEALLATATGLVAAIPAVLIYNAFARSIGAYKGSLADISAEISRLASRDHDRRTTSRFTNKSKAAE